MPSKSQLLEDDHLSDQERRCWEENGWVDSNSLLLACYRTWNKFVLLSHASVSFSIKWATMLGIS